MDQNSTNGAGTEKKNWRERLGIGAKEMPRLSEEFKQAPAAPASPPPAGAARRAPQPVTRPAPMAPRLSTANQAAAPAPAPVPAAPVSRLHEPSAQDALAEKLRAQRAAAERLAEQRVQAARERAEGRARQVEPTLSSPPRSAAPPPPPQSTRPPAVANGSGSGTSRPKFSFAEEEPARLPPNPPPLTPPRPALGGERTTPPFLRPAGGTQAPRPQPAYRADGQPTYRPADPAGAYPQPPRYQPPPPTGRGYGAEPPAGYGSRAPVRRPPPADPYARGYEPEDYYEDDPRAHPRVPPPPRRGRGRPPAAEDEYEEVFEDEARPRQRASAHDYQSAYRETEAGYEEEQRRSSGPWLLLLALLLAALVTGGVVWYYNTKMRTATSTPGTATEQAPLVTAPEQPAKVEPEAPADAQGTMSPAQKKQIYDRIVGDQEIEGGQMAPTEEIPVAPADNQSAPADQQGAVPIPAPDANAVPAGDEPAPLPLPPPPGNDVQGSLDQSGVEQIGAAAAKPDEVATAPPSSAGDVTAKKVLPPPDDSADGAVSVSEVPPPKAEPAKKKTVEKAAPQPAKKKVIASEPPPNPIQAAPPSQAVSPSQGVGTVDVSEPATEQSAAPPPRKRKTLFDLFTGNSSDAGATAPAPEADNTQVASLPAEQPAARQQPAPEPVEQASSGGSGYVVQLASFRSQSEAATEYGRLKSRYPDVIGGLPSQINQASVGGSTRYRLGVGPLASRDQASQICSSLFARGERDCLVRSQ